MKIKPSKRPKKRYIVFEVLSKDLTNDSAIYRAVEKSAVNVLGQKYQSAGIRFLKDKYQPSLHKGILKINNQYAKIIIDALNKDKYIKTIGMSGILKKAEEKYLEK